MKSERGSATRVEARAGSLAMAEALAAHLEGEDARLSQYGLTKEEQSEMASLLHIAERLNARMRPLRPSPAFVRSLGQELVQEAGRRMAKRKKRRRVAMISAAVAGGIVSVASLVGGVVVLVKWLRTRSEPRQVSAA